MRKIQKWTKNKGGCTPINYQPQLLIYSRSEVASPGAKLQQIVICKLLTNNSEWKTETLNWKPAMHLRPSWVHVPSARDPLVRLIHVTNSQKLDRTRAQASCQGNFLISPPRPRRQKEGDKLRESGWVSDHLPSNGCQISHTAPKFLHGHNIAPSQNGNYTSNRWDFHTIPK